MCHEKSHVSMFFVAFLPGPLQPWSSHSPSWWHYPPIWISGPVEGNFFPHGKMWCWKKTRKSWGMMEDMFIDDSLYMIYDIYDIWYMICDIWYYQNASKIWRSNLIWMIDNDWVSSHRSFGIVGTWVHKKKCPRTQLRWSHKPPMLEGWKTSHVCWNGDGLLFRL